VKSGDKEYFIGNVRTPKSTMWSYVWIPVNCHRVCSCKSELRNVWAVFIKSTKSVQRTYYDPGVDRCVSL
jgi:hypothetical protein